MKDIIQELIEKSEKFLDNRSQWNGNELRKTLNKIESIKTQPDIDEHRNQLLALMRKGYDVTVSGQFKAKLIGYRQESFLVEYEHNDQSDWVYIDDIKLN